MSTPEEQAVAVKNALYTGQKILAVKLYREQTGVGLAEAKEAVEKLEAELRAGTPERFTKSESKGCLSVIVAAALLGGALYPLLS